MTPRNVVIVGCGMAGARLAEQIRRRDPAGLRVALSMFGAEPHRPYNRVLLSSVVSGRMSADSVRLQAPGWAAEHHVDMRLGCAVVSIDRTHRRITLADASTVDYDALVLATGARAWVPPTEGLLGEDGELTCGVATFRTLDDCERIVSVAQTGAPVAVLGGGLLGLEAARGLAGRGNLVTVVHPVQHLMERQLDPDAGEVLARTLHNIGIRLRLGVSAVRYSPGEGLKLDDGEHVPAGLVVVATGVYPETALAAEAGLSVARGVLIDDALRTSDPSIYAIGDCAQHRGRVFGLVEPAWQQAEVLADLLTGADPAARYRERAPVTRLKAPDVELAALGEVHLGAHELDAEVVCLIQPAQGRYAKLVVREDKVAGAIVLGMPDAAASITQFYDRDLPVPTDRLALLLGRAMPAASGVPDSPAELPASSVLCWCNSVTKAHLLTAWHQGARTVAALASATRATTGCGGCQHTIHGLSRWLSQHTQQATR